MSDYRGQLYSALLFLEPLLVSASLLVSHWAPVSADDSGTGASNNPPPMMGPPKFEDASFTFDAESQSLLITLQ